MAAGELCDNDLPEEQCSAMDSCHFVGGECLSVAERKESVEVKEKKDVDDSPLPGSMLLLRYQQHYTSEMRDEAFSSIWNSFLSK